MNQNALRLSLVACLFSCFFAGKAMALTAISTCAQLQDMSEDLDEDYELSGDIDCDGQSFDPVDGFTGTFDGNGYTISNLTVNPGVMYTGMFGEVSGAEIMDFHIENGSITGCESFCGMVAGRVENSTIDQIGVSTFTITSTGDSVGGMIGYSTAGVVITGIFAEDGSVYSSGMNVGGLIGLMNGGTLHDSHADVDVEGDSFNTGGLVGQLLDGGSGPNVSRSYAMGVVDGNNRVGGLIGYMNAGEGANNCSTNDSFAVGNVTGSSNVGALVGIKFESCNIYSSFFNDTAGNPSVCVGTDGNSELTECTAIDDDAAYFYDPENAPLTAWDFSGIWREQDAYPTLAWATADTMTQSPTLASPADDAESTTTFDVDYTLPETPLANSVTLTFDDGDDTTVTLTLSDSTSGTFTLDPANIAITSDIIARTATSFGYGVYTVTLSYQDSLGNTAATDESTNVRFGSAGSSSSSSSSSSGRIGESQPGGGGGVRGSTLRAKQAKAQLRSAASSSAPVSAARETMSAALRVRTCDRVAKWFAGNAKMLERVNARLLKRFGFTCPI